MRWPGVSRGERTREGGHHPELRSHRHPPTAAVRWKEWETTRGYIRTKKVGVVVAGHASVLAEMAGFRLPVESHPLQALVSEPIKPIHHCVVMSNAVHVYVSQSDKGELVIGAGIDAYNSYAQRGSLPVIEEQMGALIELFPIFSRLRMLRQWGGIVDVCPDASPIIGKTPVRNLYFNCGWGTGGFKATPGSGWVFAHTIAHDTPHPLNAALHPRAIHQRGAHRRARCGGSGPLKPWPSLDTRRRRSRGGRDAPDRLPVVRGPGARTSSATAARRTSCARRRRRRRAMRSGPTISSCAPTAGD